MFKNLMKVGASLFLLWAVIFWWQGGSGLRLLRSDPMAHYTPENAKLVRESTHKGSRAEIISLKPSKAKILRTFEPAPEADLEVLEAQCRAEAIRHGWQERTTPGVFDRPDNNTSLTCSIYRNEELVIILREH